MTEVKLNSGLGLWGGGHLAKASVRTVDAKVWPDISDPGPVVKGLGPTPACDLGKGQSGTRREVPAGGREKREDHAGEGDALAPEPGAVSLSWHSVPEKGEFSYTHTRRRIWLLQTPASEISGDETFCL